MLARKIELQRLYGSEVTSKNSTTLLCLSRVFRSVIAVALLESRRSFWHYFMFVRLSLRRRKDGRAGCEIQIRRTVISPLMKVRLRIDAA
jgi:hypothetical protein